MVSGQRVPGDIEKAAEVRDGLINMLQESPAVQVVSPAVLDRNNPGFILAMNDGIFIVSVQKCSSATVEQVGDSHV